MGKKWVVSTLVIFIISQNSALAGTIDHYQFKKTYKSSSGAVVFYHDRHANTYAKDCAYCHSALKIFGGEVNKLFAHNFCNNCHVKNQSIASKGCSGCHDETMKLSMK